MPELTPIFAEIPENLRDLALFEVTRIWVKLGAQQQGGAQGRPIFTIPGLQLATDLFAGAV